MIRPGQRLGRRLAGVVAAATLAVLGVPLLAQASYADGDGLVVDHAQATPGHLELLVTVPGTDPIDTSSVAATIGGHATRATAVAAADSSEIKRVTVLAFDTSLSMKGARITEARKAATTYLHSAPANVEIGIVAFDNGTRVVLPPTLDRAAATQALDGLQLHLKTSLYAGVVAAAKETGTTGERQVLLLSDGADTTHSPIAPTLTALKRSGVRVDVVSLQHSASGNKALGQLASATKGAVSTGLDPASLTAAFTTEADRLARQVAVDVTVPSGQKHADATVSVRLGAGTTTYATQAYFRVIPPTTKAARTAADHAVVHVGRSALDVSPQVLMGGVAAVVLGLIALVLAIGMRPGKPSAKKGLARHLDAYGLAARVETGQHESASVAEQAKEAAAKALARNRGLEQKVSARLDAAGMSLKPPEWVLLHAAIAFGTALVGLVLFNHVPVLVVVFLALGVAGPWVYLGFKASRRLKSFEANLADTLQLMSGSLSAGLSLAQSLDTIVREGTDPIASEFRRVLVESRLGVTLEDALDKVAERMRSRDFAWVVMAIRIQREVGGNLAELLLTVAGTLREREYLRRHVKALSAEGRLSCYILGGLPPMFLLYLTVSKPDYVHPLYTTPLGYILLTVMTVMLSVGVFWMSKVSKVAV